MAGQHQAGLWSAPGGAVELPLSLVPRESGRLEKRMKEITGHLHDLCKRGVEAADYAACAIG